jgi:hypothetical protein
MRAGPTPRAAGLLLGLALGLGAIAGCGGSTADEGIEARTPAQILAASQLAAEAAGSVHVAGTIVSAGTPITLDLSLLAGSGARGRISEKGLGFEVIRSGEALYIKGSEALYRQLASASAARLLAGRWLKVPAHSPGFASLSSLTNLRTLIDTTFANQGAPTKGSLTTINGEGAVAVSDRARGGTIYVATTGLPYPLQVIGSATSPGTVSFDDWNGPVTLAPPPGAIELGRLSSRR